MMSSAVRNQIPILLLCLTCMIVMGSRRAAASGGVVAASASSQGGLLGAGLDVAGLRHAHVAFRAAGEEVGAVTTAPATTAAATAESSINAQQVLLVVVADIILLCGAALFAGLTLAVMGLDTLSLEIIANSGTEPDRTYAARILPLRRLGNQLLCTLILGNVMVNTLIAQLTDSLVKGWVATLVSTVLITLGGEIIPQAAMSAHALAVGSRSSVIVRFFVFAFYPICKPLSMFLDRVIGTDPGQIYNRGELKDLMYKHALHSSESGLKKADLDLMVGAMELREKTVQQVLTPIQDVFMLEASERITEELLQLVAERGYSRVPIYRGQRNNIVALLHAKDLLLASAADNTRVGDLAQFYHRVFHIVPLETKLISMLRYFQTGRSHIAVVQEVQTRDAGDPYYAVRGVVTLEDVLEELLHTEIYDEFDTWGAGGGSDHTNGAQSPSAIAAHRRGAATRSHRRIHLGANQLTACALFLQQALPEFAQHSADRLTALLGQFSVAYKIRPPRDAAGLDWDDPNTVLLYRAGSGHAEVAVTSLVVSGLLEVTPSLVASPASSTASGGAGAAATGLGPGIVDKALVAELPLWSLVNVEGMRGTGSATAHRPTNGTGTATTGTTTSKAHHHHHRELDFYCRVVQDTVVLQISSHQYTGLLAALRRDPASVSSPPPQASSSGGKS